MLMYLPYVNTGQDGKRGDCGESSEEKQMKNRAGPLPEIVRRQPPATVVLSLALTLTACTPSPQKVTMTDPSNTTQSSGARGPEQSAPGTIPPVAAPNAEPLTNTPAEALGRRTLSTAFVRVGPDGHLTVELLDGRVIVLRDVIMGSKDYCGVQIAGNPPSTKYCGGYAEVAAARPGGGGQPDSEITNAGEPARGPVKGS
jgi:hypothetical protein